MSYVRITKEEMDKKLKPDKGWFCTQTGNEYIYDFHLSKYPIIVKVASSIRLDNNKARNKGADCIRIYAVKKENLDKKAKIISGLIKASRIYRTTGWDKRVEEKVYATIKRAKMVYCKYQKGKK